MTNAPIYDALSACIAAKAQAKENRRSDKSIGRIDWIEHTRNRDAKLKEKDSYAETDMYHIFSTDDENHFEQAQQHKERGEIDEVVLIKRNEELTTYTYAGSSDTYMLRSCADSEHDKANDQTSIWMQNRPCGCHSCLYREQVQYRTDSGIGVDPGPCQNQRMTGVPTLETHHLQGKPKSVVQQEHIQLQNKINKIKNFLFLSKRGRQGD
mmetsp:Transcript_2462/g.3828  ORF Transcript_2462/g.3828 Transcript_2462/m.3828 type:complete len:210 (-) Transcript_2462:184-813(-)